VLATEPRPRRTTTTRPPPQHAMAPDQAATGVARTGETLSVREAATLLGRDRTRVYALIRSGDLAVVPDAAADGTALRIDRSSVERWAAAGGSSGRPLTAGHAWALIALASGDAALRDRCLGLLERPEEISRVRAHLAGHSLLDLASRLRRRAAVTVLHLPPPLLAALDRDASLVRTGISAARAYGWEELGADQVWAVDAYLPLAAVRVLLEQVNGAGSESSAADALARAVLLRAVDGPWPFPPHSQLVPQPLAALDLLEYPDATARRMGREVLRGLADTTSTTVARRTARARTLHGPLVGKLLGAATGRGPRPSVAGDPHTDTPAAAAHIVGVLWAGASQGATVKELRAAIGLTRERLEAAYEYLLEHPPAGLTIQRHRDELFLVAAPEVAPSIERHLAHPRPVPLSRAATEVLAIIAYKQPITRTGIETIRGTASDSALDTLLARGLVSLDEAHLFTTTRAFLDVAGLRDLADLPPLVPDDTQDHGLVAAG